MDPTTASTGGQWSGLETQGMKEAKCSLLLRQDSQYKPKIKALPPQSVVVFQDTSHGSNHFSVNFEGCTILQLEPIPDTQQITMPVTLTVAGRCQFTKESHKHFSIMMRTKEESEELRLQPNGVFDWPGVQSFLSCPVCSKRARVTGNKEYWMLFYPSLQIAVTEKSKMTLGTRTLCRLTCIDCMESLLEGLELPIMEDPTNSTNQPTSISVLDILKEAGTASFLQDDPLRPSEAPHVDDPLDAWTLYRLWEHSGAWEALQIDYRQSLASSMHAAAPTTSIKAESSLPVSSPLKARLGRTCGNPECAKVHGKSDPNIQHRGIVRLTVVCEKCKAAYYCSQVCRHAALNSHSSTCAPLTTTTSTTEKKKKMVKCETCRTSAPYTDMKKCSRCRSVIYCSSKCQKEGWPSHRADCTPRESTKQVAK